jgi:hypothetical protein
MSTLTSDAGSTSVEMIKGAEQPPRGTVMLDAVLKVIRCPVIVMGTVKGELTELIVAVSVPLVVKTMFTI